MIRLLLALLGGAIATTVLAVACSRLSSLTYLSPIEPSPSAPTWLFPVEPPGDSNPSAAYTLTDFGVTFAGADTISLCYPAFPRVQQIQFDIGWPLRAFRANISAGEAAISEPPGHIQQVVLQLLPGDSPIARLFLPLHHAALQPLWIGFSIDSLGFALVLVATVRAWSFCRNTWRRRRHCCTWCGYPLPGARRHCPECGVARPAT